VPVDASIPLAGIDPNAQAWNPQRTMSLLDFAQQMRARQQAQQQQNALRSIFANPASMTPDGQMRPEAVAQVMQIDPKTGMALREQMMTNQVQQSTIGKNEAQMGAAQTEQALKKQAYIEDTVRAPAIIAYEKAIKAGIPPAQATQVAQVEFSKGLDAARASGIFSEDEQGRLPKSFDYQRVTTNSKSYKDYVAQQEKKDADARAEKSEAERERHDRSMEGAAAARENRLAGAIEGQSGKPPAGYRWSKDKPGELEVIPGGPAARKEGAGLTVADKMNPVMLATVTLDIKEGRKALDFMEKAGLDKGSPFYADEHGAGAGRRLINKFIAPEKEQEFDVYANKLGQAIASAQSMGRGQISEAKIREAQKAIPVEGDSKHIREVKMGQLKAFFNYVDEVLKTPIKPGARGASDQAAEQQDAADFSALWK